MEPESGDREAVLRLNGLSEAGRRCFEMGRATWPKFAVDSDRFETYFARHAASKTPPREAHAADMYLACACAGGVASALAVLERTLESDVARAVASIDTSHAFVEDVLQGMNELLLVRRSSGLCKILDYGGRASLRSWLCAVAVRWAISRQRRKGEQRHGRFATQDDRQLAKGGPELEYLRGRYKGAFETALRSAIEQLSSRERMLLRLNLVEGMSIDKLGTSYQVGRSTAARWLASARQALLQRTRYELRTKLHLTSTELESIAKDMCSQIEVSIMNLLAFSRGDDA